MRQNLAAVLLAILASVFSPPAHASLGDHLVTAGASETQNAFTVRATQLGATQIKEYVSTSGQVFAVVWSGLTHPNLQQVLGSYYEEYSQARQASRSFARSHASVRSEHAVVETWGHMRRLQGRAYDPALLPLGVTLEEIRAIQ